MSPAEPARLVLDTQVVLDLLHFADPRTRSLRGALDARRAVVVSDAACRDEYRRVLLYRALRLDAARREDLERRYDDLVVLHSAASAPASTRAPLPRCSDPDDQKFLELADRCAASTLVTRDAALLRLARRCVREGRFSIVAPEDFAAPA